MSQAQTHQDSSSLRIKFASIDEYGVLCRDASGDYGFLRSALLEGWSAEEAEPVNTVGRDRNPAWVLRADSETVVAVQHETGLELLLAVGVNVASVAVVALVSWAWQRWRSSRAEQIRLGTKQEPTLVLEAVEDRLADGRIRSSRKLEFRGPIDEAAVAQAVRHWQGLQSRAT